MGAEQRVEARELEPADIEFTREFSGGDEAPGIAAPEGREAERVVDPHRHVRGQRRPPRLHVAGPDPAAIALHSCEAVAVQTPGANVRAVLERTLEVTAVPGQPRLNWQLVSIVGPPGIDAEVEGIAVSAPVVAYVKRRVGLLVQGRAKEVPRDAVDVEDDPEVEIV